MILLKNMRIGVGNLKESYKKLSRFQRWCFPSDLAKALDNLQNEQLESTSLLPVYQAFAQTYFRRIWFLISWINPILDVFAYADRFFINYVPLKGISFLPSTTEQVCEAYQAGLLKGDLAQVIFDALALSEGSSKWIINVLKVLKKADLLTQTNIEMLAEKHQAEKFVTALNMLYAKGLLIGEHAQNNFCALLALSDCYKNLLALIQKEEITQETLNAHVALCLQKNKLDENSEKQIVNPIPPKDFTITKISKIPTNITSTVFGLFQVADTKVDTRAAAPQQNKGLSF